MIRNRPICTARPPGSWKLAALALLLGVVGLYGVVAYSVSQRTREIGVRIALGAERSSVYRLVLKEAGRLTVLGVVIGLIASLALPRSYAGCLFGVRFLGYSDAGHRCYVLGVSALLASFLPARRAGRRQCR